MPPPISLAICFMHSYTFADHEQAIASLAREMGFAHVGCSAQLMPMARMVPRGFTAATDAYLTPIITQYIHSFASGFEPESLKDVRLTFMKARRACEGRAGV